MIIQTVTWVCDRCKKMESYSKEVCLLDDPVVTREGWDYTMDTEELLCVMCLHDEKMRVSQMEEKMAELLSNAVKESRHAIEYLQQALLLKRRR
uniref:Uncharacterized protein n=1 Tax=viral metagenome TaxID=1070528 RepID=A0A6M3K7V0_9ZZZZ